MAVARATLDAVGLPHREAIAFLAQKVNIPTERWFDVWRTGHSHGFMVAGAQSEAMLADFRREIERGAAGETTGVKDFEKQFVEIARRYGWEYNGTPGWRSRIIYETNLSTALSAGRYAQMTRPEVLAAYPYWQYRHSGSAHPRKQHLAWNGLTLRADDPFWATHYPPNGWRCGCRVVPLSARDLVRRGITPGTAPPVVTRPWTNPRTGVTSEVPEGIDPGFDYNPGQAWKGGALPAIPTDAVWAPPPGWMPPVPRLPGAAAGRLARRAPVDDVLPVARPAAPGAPDVPLPPEPPAEERASLLASLWRLQGEPGARIGDSLDLPALRLLADAAEAERRQLLDRLRELRGERARQAAERDSLEELRAKVEAAERGA